MGVCQGYIAEEMPLVRNLCARYSCQDMLEEYVKEEMERKGKSLYSRTEALESVKAFYGKCKADNCLLAISSIDGDPEIHCVNPKNAQSTRIVMKHLEDALPEIQRILLLLPTLAGGMPTGGTDEENIRNMVKGIAQAVLEKLEN